MMMSPLEQAGFLTSLMSEGYTNLRPIDEGRSWAGLFRFMFTTAIIVGRMGDTCGYAQHWCFDDEAKAREALEKWDGTGDPEGWHRHLPSNRRRHNGEEYIAP